MLKSFIFKEKKKNKFDDTQNGNEKKTKKEIKSINYQVIEIKRNNS